MSKYRVTHLQTHWFESTTSRTSDEPVLTQRFGTFGQIVKIPRAQDVDYLMGLGAIEPYDGDAEVGDTVSAEEAVANEDGFDLSLADAAEIADYIRDKSPTVSQLVKMVGDDPELAIKVMDAEDVATDGNSRSTLVDALEKVVG